MDDPNIEARTASGLVVNLSSYLVTGAIAMLGAQAVILTFVLDKRNGLIPFYCVSACASFALTAGIFLGGRGIYELIADGHKGTWKIYSRRDDFNRQALATLLGILFLGISAFLGSPKDSQAEIQNASTISSLRQDIAAMEQRLQTLELKLNDQQNRLDSVTRVAASPKNKQDKGQRAKETRSH